MARRAPVRLKLLECAFLLWRVWLSLCAHVAVVHGELYLKDQCATLR